MASRGWKAGAAATIITPFEPMWLAGWAARREPSRGTAMDLCAKAIAFEDATGERAIIVTADLIAIPRDLAVAVAMLIQQRHGISRERLLFNASHTHNGPEVRPDKVPFFEIPPQFAERISPYALQLVERIAAVIAAALDRLEPATLRVQQLSATFAANRRSPDGAVDHDVPLLAVYRGDGTSLALLFGYACHNLTLPPTDCEFHGDYAGVAQSVIETRFPGTTALFLSGAGADQDPSPRGTRELARAHGEALGNQIACEWDRPACPVGAELRVAFEEVMLDLLPLPAITALEEDLRSDDAPRRRKAEFLLRAVAEKRHLATTQACPVQVLQFGRELLLIALGGEPVVDYSRHFKREFAGPVVWVAGYSNDLFGYLPTRQIQHEGGYEAGRASLWSAVPTPLAPTAEARVTDCVRRLVERVRQPTR
jgi:neutral ceramidase